MKNNLPKICYWCGKGVLEVSLTTEHIPPKGFFPKGYRNNLMTVPSCEKHNNHFSELDEKFQFYLKAHRSNSVANNDFLDTVVRGLKRKEKEGFVKSFNKDTGFGLINGKPTIFTKLQPFEPDIFIEKTIRALYFYHLEEPAEGIIQWVSKYIYFQGIDSISGVDFLKEGLDERIFKLGDFNNPEVFQYKYLNYQGFFMILLNFYEGVEFIGWVLPKGFTYDNFNPEDYGYSEEQLQSINNKNKVIYPDLELDKN